MHRQRKRSERTLTVGQVAKRWSVAVERVRQLVAAGYLPGAFVIPSAGRYGETVKIPLAVVEAAEERWRLVPVAREAAKPVPPTRGSSALKHFPDLTLEPDVECP